MNLKVGEIVDLQDESIPLWVRTAAWIDTLDVRHGSLAGQKFELLPFQVEVIMAVCDPRYEHICLSIARGNGKTTLLAAIAACAIAGPLAIPNAIIPVVASDKTQAGITVEHAFNFLEPWRQADPERWAYRDNKDEWMIRDKYNNIEIQAVSADPRAKHGASFALAIEDEPAQWSPNAAEKVHNAMLGSRGKQGHSRVVTIGTLPDSPHHFFSRALRVGTKKSGRKSGTWARCYAADANAEFDDIEQIKKANPVWDHIKSLQKTICKEIEGVRSGKDSKAAFRAYRMNQGVIETGPDEYLLGENTLDIWKSCVLPEHELDLKHPRRGPCFVGLDTGQAKSMTAAAFYWPETGRFEAYAALPNGDVNIEEREREDGNAGIYTAAIDNREMKLFPRQVTPLDGFLKWILELLNGYDVEAVFADQYRKGDVMQAILDLKCGWDSKIDFRRAGRGPDGHSDIQNFCKDVFEGHLKCRTSVLMLTALRDARVKRDTNQNASLDKSKNRARIDVLQAAVLAVAAGYRSRLPDPDATRQHGTDSYLFVPRKPQIRF